MIDLAERCPRCLLRPARCLCALVVPVTARTEVIVVRHIKERYKTSNTARLA